MLLHSTRRQSPPVTFREALMRGIAPDGGLYLPVGLPVLPRAQIEAWRRLPLSTLSARLAEHLLSGEVAPGAIESLVGDAFSFPAPTVRVEHRSFVLELFHGPTLAFKDFGARFLARFFGHFLAERGDHATILVATSGDTGSAVAHGFYQVPNIRVVLLYPAGRISPFQQAQMSALGGNVIALAVPGTFDDCQRLVKAAFLDRSLEGLKLSSANSINIGRLIPQSFYYFASYLSVGDAPDGPVVFSVPSGNLGNLTAGVMAQRMGLPVRRFVAATNVNDVLPEYLRTGVYRARPAIPTLSNAMDVGDPSNFPRLLELHGDDPAAMRQNLAGITVSESETRATIRAVHERTGYLLDPHGAVGYAAGERYRVASATERPIISLATAHPGKFGLAIAEELGFAPALPEAFRDWEKWPRAIETLSDTNYDTFREFLLDS